MIVANPQRAWQYANLCVVTSVLGGIVGYYIGLALYDTLGIWIMQLYGLTQEVVVFQEQYNRYGIWIILTKGLTPIPYKVVTIVSGFTRFDFISFVAASIVARSTRFYMLAFLLQRYGDAVRRFIEKRLGLAFLILIVGIVGSFYALKFFPW